MGAEFSETIFELTKLQQRINVQLHAYTQYTVKIYTVQCMLYYENAQRCMSLSVNQKESALWKLLVNRQRIGPAAQSYRCK